jgi:hypothetical protein
VLSKSSFAHYKRSAGCAEIGYANYYQTDGGTFQIFCDFVWHAVNSLSGTFTVDFVSCMDACITWNTNHSEKCVGVIWRSGYYGPLGAAGGSTCSIQWNMVQSQGYNQTSFDSARLLDVPLPNVFPSKSLTSPLTFQGDNASPCSATNRPVYKRHNLHLNDWSKVRYVMWY